MDLDDYGYFDGAIFYFRQPFAFLHTDGVTLMDHIDCRRWKDKVNVEAVVSSIIEQQRGVPDPLRERDPHQDAPKTDPGE